jgi:hypothetical protein
VPFATNRLERLKESGSGTIMRSGKELLISWVAGLYAPKGRIPAGDMVAKGATKI